MLRPLPAARAVPRCCDRGRGGERGSSARAPAQAGQPELEHGSGLHVCLRLLAKQRIPRREGLGWLGADRGSVRLPTAVVVGLNASVKRGLAALPPALPTPSAFLQAKSTAEYVQASKARIAHYEQQVGLAVPRRAFSSSQPGAHPALAGVCSAPPWCVTCLFCSRPKLQKLKSMIPFEQMTFEDLHEAFPETRLDKEKYPYWPHKPITEL